MKRLIAIILSCCLCVALSACARFDYNKAQTAFASGDFEEAHALFAELGDYEDSAEMTEKCSYQLGIQLMEQKKYSEAIKRFEALGDYGNCAALIRECRIGQVDVLLQGTWTSVQLDIIEVTYRFTAGKYHTTMTVNGSSLSNEGSYRIDLDSNSIYICRDYTVAPDGTKLPEAEEKLLLTFTQKDGGLKLTDSGNNLCTKEG